MVSGKILKDGRYIRKLNRPVAPLALLFSEFSPKARLQAPPLSMHRLGGYEQGREFHLLTLFQNLVKVL